MVVLQILEVVGNDDVHEKERKKEKKKEMLENAGMLINTTF